MVEAAGERGIYQGGYKHEEIKKKRFDHNVCGRYGSYRVLRSEGR